MKTIRKMHARAARGFTLIELMIVVAIIGVLAAVALPAYSDYLVRARASELTLATSAFRTGVAEFVASEGRFPVNIQEAGLVIQSSQHVSSLFYELSGNEVLIIATGDSSTLGIDPNLTLTTVLVGALNSNNNTVGWACGTVQNTGETFPFLPANCRQTLADARIEANDHAGN